jgi:hypothetical protein
MAAGKLKELTLAVEKSKAQLRAAVEHPFHVLKNLFGHRKARDRSLAKNTAQLHGLFALVNLVIPTRIYERRTCSECSEEHEKSAHLTIKSVAKPSKSNSQGVPTALNMPTS